MDAPTKSFALANRPTSFLDGIVTPEALKRLSDDDLTSLAQEIRQEIIGNLAKTGGHLASNLGIVEITLALHKVFKSPADKILWDVGHQCYVHKLLTGRRQQFTTLRQFKGLSGYVNPLESEHDAFNAGHSSTSISLAVGMAIARDHFEQDHKVIAVIGDGGLTGGMALEAINHLGHIQKDVIIVLNDNEMSISENLGGISQYMKRIKETFFYQDIKQKLDFIEGRLDEVHLTSSVRDLIQAVKKQAKERFDTPGIVFEKLGVNYTGPVDGHDVSAVISAFEKVRSQSTPQLVHIITRKGKGYAPAENDAIKYHGISAFTLEPQLSEKIEPVQVSKPKAKTYSDVFSEALIELAKLEPHLVAITPATAEGSGLVKFGKAYPERFFDVAICEQHAVTMAAGMSKAGLKPVVSIYSTFLQRAMDQVIHDVAILGLPVIFGIDRGGLVEDGETHQGVFDIAFLRSVPNFTVIAPRNAQELRNMLYTAVLESSGPVAIRFPRDKAVDAEGYFPFEEMDYRTWEVLHEAQTTSTPSKTVVLAYGAMVDTVLKALPKIQAAGCDATIINARSTKPLDLTVLQPLVDDPSVRLITLEEGCRAGGFGSAVLEWAADRRLSTRRRQAEIIAVGVPDRFIEHGNRATLLHEVGLSADAIAELIMNTAT